MIAKPLGNGLESETSNEMILRWLEPYRKVTEVMAERKAPKPGGFSLKSLVQQGIWPDPGLPGGKSHLLIICMELHFDFACHPEQYSLIFVLSVI
jgi:hypothetical protein